MAIWRVPGRNDFLVAPAAFFWSGYGADNGILTSFEQAQAADNAG